MSLNAVARLVRGAAKNSQIALLVGAGISRPSPSFLPTAPELVDSLLIRIFGSHQDTRPSLTEDLRRQLIRLPFESFLSILSQALEEKTVSLLDCLRHGEHNGMHKFVAYCVQKNWSRNVLTTNFDSLIEQALGDWTTKIRVDFDSLHLYRSNDIPCVTKLHGSFVDNNNHDVSASIATTIESISRNASQATIERVARELKNKFVFVMGYSGSDKIDILPALRRAEWGRMLWIDHGEGPINFAHPNSLPSGVASLFSSSDILLRGETLDICSKLAGVRIPRSNIVRSSRDCDLVKADAIPPGYERYLAGLLMLVMGPNEQFKAETHLRRFVESDAPSIRDRAKALCSLGQSLNAIGEFEDSRDCFVQGLNIFDKIGDDHRVATTLVSLGIVSEKINNRLGLGVRIAENYIYAGLDLANKRKDLLAQNMAFHALGNLQQRLRKLKNAEEFYSKAALCAQESGALHKLITSLTERLDIRLKLYRDDLAQKKHVDDVVKILQLIDFTGTDEPGIVSQNQGTCAGLFAKIYGIEAEKMAASHPVLRTLECKGNVLEIVNHILRVSS